MITGIIILFLSILLLFFISAIRLSSECDRQIREYFYIVDRKSDNNKVNITK